MVKIFSKKTDADIQIIVFDASKKDKLEFLDKEEQIFINQKLEQNIYIIPLVIQHKQYVLYGFKEAENSIKTKEQLRLDASSIQYSIKEKKELDIVINFIDDLPLKFKKAFLEGILLSNYTFEKYLKNKSLLLNIFCINNQLPKSTLDELNHLCTAITFTKNLVNEPFNFLTTQQYTEEIKTIFKNTPVKHTYWNQQRLQKEKMGGILAVHKASTSSVPYFHILEYKPTDAINKQPLVLVGKGVMYDTGGLSLKPTPNSMDLMKCDMAGAATVVGVIYAIAQMKLPYHVVGLMPTVENKIGEHAICPGDIITMYDGTTVEVMNTDAEGRLILADALHYAKRLNPELVIDLATLTGAAIRAVGKEAAVAMSNANKQWNKQLNRAANKTYERLIFLPLWEEYKEYLKSDIADIRNVGSNGEPGAITAGKFLEHFTAYPWVHIDLSPAYVTHQYNYRGKYATAFGVRLLCKFVKNLSKTKKEAKHDKSTNRQNKSRNKRR